MNATTSNLLAVHDLTFRFGEKTVLDNCQFSVKRKDRLVLMGQSGCGKSTLLRLILGLLQPDSGTIRFQDREITKLELEELNVVRQKMGMVYQSAALVSSLTVEDNLALPLRELTDKSLGEIGDIVEEKLDLVGMKKSKALLPSELSGGMQKRVGLARALVLKPELILFDEPSAGLDPVNAVLIEDLIVHLSEKTGATCIVVTHNMASAFRIGTRMAMLHHGQVIEDSTPEKFRESKNPVVRQFVTGDPKGPLTEERNHENSKE